jgi:hypothetical protein
MMTGILADRGEQRGYGLVTIRQNAAVSFIDILSGKVVSLVAALPYGCNDLVLCCICCQSMLPNLRGYRYESAQ